METRLSFCTKVCHDLNCLLEVALLALRQLNSIHKKGPKRSLFFTEVQIFLQWANLRVKVSLLSTSESYFFRNLLQELSTSYQRGIKFTQEIWPSNLKILYTITLEFIVMERKWKPVKERILIKQQQTEEKFGDK